MKVLGLIGGTSWYSTVEYYSYLNRAVNDAYRNNTNPPLILYNMNQQKIHDLQAANDWEGIAALYTQAAMRLRASGAQGIVFCANTPHKVYTHVARKLDNSHSPHCRCNRSCHQASGPEEGWDSWNALYDAGRIHS
jgi:aspartate racemase